VLQGECVHVIGNGVGVWKVLGFLSSGKKWVGQLLMYAKKGKGQSHAFGSGDYHQHKGLSEVIETSVENTFSVDKIDYYPAVVAHWETLKGRPMWNLVGRDCAYVIGSKKSGKGKKLQAIRAVGHPLFPDMDPFFDQHILTSWTRHFMDTLHIIGQTLRHVMQVGGPDMFSACEPTENITREQWEMILLVTRGTPEEKKVISKRQQIIDPGFTFWNKAYDQTVEKVGFTTKSEMEPLTNAFGFGYNIALTGAKIKQAGGVAITPQTGVNIKVIHPNIAPEDIPPLYMTKYRQSQTSKSAPKRKRAGGPVALRKPGLYLTYTRPVGGTAGILSIACSWHDKVFRGLQKGWEKAVAEPFLN